MKDALFALFMAVVFIAAFVFLAKLFNKLKSIDSSSELEYSITCIKGKTIIYEGKVSGLKTEGSFFFFNDIERDLRVVTNFTCIAATENK